MAYKEPHRHLQRPKDNETPWTTQEVFIQHLELFQLGDQPFANFCWGYYNKNKPWPNSL